MKMPQKTRHRRLQPAVKRATLKFDVDYTEEGMDTGVGNSGT